MRTLFFCLMVLLPTVVHAQFTLARLNYGGGGDWYNDSDILPNLAAYANSILGYKAINEDEAIVKADDNHLFNYPYLFITGHGNLAFSATETENLRQYLQNGGFIFADDDYGMDKSFRREIKNILPEYELIEIPAGDKLYHCYFDFPQGLPKTHKHDDKRPVGYGIFNKEGRLMVFYSYEANISDGWSKNHGDAENVRLEALKMGFNLLYYLTSCP